MYWIFVFIVSALLAILPASIASRKGKNFTTWYIYGFLIWIVAIFHAISLPELVVKDEKRERELQAADSNKMKSVNNSSQIIESESIDINAKVRISSWDIQKNQSEDVFLKVEFYNVAEKTVSAINMIIKGYDSFGNVIKVDEKETFSILLQDLKLQPYPNRSASSMVHLPNNTIRKVEIFVSKICYSDGQIEEMNSPDFVMSCQNPMDSKYVSMVGKVVPYAKYYTIKTQEYWQCPCGMINTGKRCTNCETLYNSVKSYCEDTIETEYKDYLARQELERQRIEERKKQEEEQQKKEHDKKKKTIIVIATSVVCICIIGIIINNILNKKTYQTEQVNIEEAIASGEYDKAFEIMTLSNEADKLLDGYGDSVFSQIRDRDLQFCESSWDTAYDDSEILYNPDYSRDGQCYIMYRDTDEILEEQTLYIVDENGNKEELLNVYGEFSDISGIYDQYGGGAIWSNGWIFVKVDDDLGSDEYYAFKYDIERKILKEVKLNNEFDMNINSCIKLKDGNILLSNAYFSEEIRWSNELYLFNTDKGDIQKVSYYELEDLYPYESDELSEKVLFDSEKELIEKLLN